MIARLAPFLCAAAVVATASVAHAAPVTARIGAEPTRVHVGDELEVALEVEREGASAPPSPELPASILDAFEVGFCQQGRRRSAGTFSGMQTVESLSCSLTATKAGKHKLAFTVDDGGTKIRSNSITIQVLEATSIEVVDPTLDQPTHASGDVFLWASTDKIRAFVGEQITYRLDVYEGVRFLEPQMRTPPSFQDFFAEEIPLPELRKTDIEGREYIVRPGVRRALFPQRAGTLTIGPAEVAVGRRRNVQSVPIEIDVVALPAEGQPPSFPSNNVGKYSIDASVDREEVQPGEPFTLSVVVEGTGNIDVLEVGAWPKIPGVRRYDPKTESTPNTGEIIGGTLRYDFLLIPDRPGKVTIPPHELPYFDPAGGVYEVAKSKPIDVLVGGDPNAIVDTEDAADAEQAAALAEPLAPVIAVDAVPRRVPDERWLTDERWTWGMLAVPLVAIVGLGAGMVWRRFGPDEGARGRAKVRRRRRERIEEARAAAVSGEGFHTAIAKLLQEVALERAGAAGVGLPRPQLRRLLEQRGVAPEDGKRLEVLLERCDEARFAGEGGAASDREALLEDALAVIRAITKGADG